MDEPRHADRGGPVRLGPHNFPELVRGLPAKARMVLSAAMGMEFGSLKVTTPEGRELLVAGRRPGPQAEVVLKNWRLPGRAFAAGTIGVAESYMDGDWESPDVTSFLELFVVNVEAGEKVAGTASRASAAMHRLVHWLNRNTRRGARRNISSHYDLGNSFYRQWLDPGMTYSSARFAPGDTLEQAQIRKIGLLLDRLRLRPGDRLLEIGSGWGTLAIEAAKRFPSFEKKFYLPAESVQGEAHRRSFKHQRLPARAGSVGASVTVSPRERWR